MKYLLGLIIALASITASAQHYRGPGLRYDGFGWAVPAMVGGIIGYEVSKNQQAPVIVQPAPVIVQQLPPSTVIDPNIVYINGTSYRKQYMNIDGVWREVLVH